METKTLVGTQSFTDMADTIHLTVHNIPTSFKKVAGYDTGSPDILWTAVDWARFPNSGRVHVNQDPSTGPYRGNVLDVEEGAWSIPQAVEACKARHAAGRFCNIYIQESNLHEFILECKQEGVKDVRMWVADWNLSKHEAEQIIFHNNVGDFPIVAIQWASPISNPNTILPGTKMTLSQANVDLSVTASDWFAAHGATDVMTTVDPAPPAMLEAFKPSPADLPETIRHGIVITSDLTTFDVTSEDGGKTWQLV